MQLSTYPSKSLPETTRVLIPIESVSCQAFKIPTPSTQSDGTFTWDSTTLVSVHISAAGEEGFGYTYASAAVATLIEESLAERLQGLDALSPELAYRHLQYALRNVGRPGIGAEALSALDCGLWDLKAKLLKLPLAVLLGPVRNSVEVYWSGGFTSRNEKEVAKELEKARSAGIRLAKIKIGRGEALRRRAQLAKRALGSEGELFVDANGAFDRKEALAVAEALADVGVSWFEEPVSSDDLEGLRLLRDRGPAGLDIAAGEYGYDLFYFRRMLEAGAVDVLQADATRCGGITGFLKVATLCESRSLPLSSHTAPSIHLHLGCSVGQVRHLEYFADHVRIEHRYFDGAQSPINGRLAPDFSRPGLGVELKQRDLERLG